MTVKIAVIGCGNMSWPIITRIHETYPEIEFHTYTPSKTRSQLLSQEVGGIHHDELHTFEEMDYWFIACKPQQVEQLSIDLGVRIHGQKIISILASTNFTKLKKELNTSLITRVMPNTPSLLGKGIELVLHNSELDKADQLFINKLFTTCGEVLLMNSEKELDELTVFSGSGPAYIYRFALAYEKKIIDMGYSQEMARKLLDQLFTGSSSLMKDSTDDLQTLVDKVTSKGGVTIEAVNCLELSNIDETVSNSIESALERGYQITQELNS
jgi:pyrroline-5-carboxylate reductase